MKEVIKELKKNKELIRYKGRNNEEVKNKREEIIGEGNLCEE